MKEITTIDELNDCLESTSERPVFIFKHSTRCPIFARANSQAAQFLENKTDKKGGIPEFHLLKVVIHSRYVTFQMAEVAILRRLFKAILRRISRLDLLSPVPT